MKNRATVIATATVTDAQLSEIHAKGIMSLTFRIVRGFRLNQVPDSPLLTRSGVESLRKRFYPRKPVKDLPKAKVHPPWNTFTCTECSSVNTVRFPHQKTARCRNCDKEFLLT